jgi:hypothetical protein
MTVAFNNQLKAVKLWREFRLNLILTIASESCWVNSFLFTQHGITPTVFEAETDIYESVKTCHCPEDFTFY